MALQDERRRNELPDIISDEVVFCDKILIHRKMHYLALARNLKLYEFHEKQFVNSIDLSETYLKKVALSVQNYKGWKRKWVANVSTPCKDSLSVTKKSSELMETSELQSTEQLMEKPTDNLNIFFGKYVYRNFDINKVYLLICCWDKLIVIDLQDHRLITEYEYVKSFRIVHGKQKFEAILEIQFKDNNCQYADFQQCDNIVNLADTNDIASDRHGLKQLLERVRCAKSELQLYKSITQKEFDILREQETFGSNFVRSDQLEEKPMISRCGDIWLRFVTNDTIVFGVPLINNCSTSSLTIIKSLKPILKMNDCTAESIIYKYRLYQLRLNFDDLETMETFFQTEDEELLPDAKPWVHCELPQLVPTSFAVVLIAIKISQLLLLKECFLFLYFQIEKAQPTRQINFIKKLSYEQHIFLKRLNISQLLINRRKYELLFSPSSFYQDFLATAMINKESVLRIQFLSMHSAYIFEELIANKYKFTIVNRKPNPHEYEADHENQSESKEADHNKFEKKYFVSHLYFNNDPTSLWFRSMVLKTFTVAESEGVQIWKIYLCNKENTFICLKLLFSDLHLVNCKIKNMEFFSKKKCMHEESFLNIKKALQSEREELNNFNEITDDVGRRIFFDKLMERQLNVDILLRSVN